MILNGKKRPILVAGAHHHRSRITCLGPSDLGRIAIMGSRKVPDHRLASPLGSPIGLRPEIHCRYLRPLQTPYHDQLQVISHFTCNCEAWIEAWERGPAWREALGKGRAMFPDRER